MSQPDRAPPSRGSEKHIDAVEKIRHARQDAKRTLNKMRSELKKERSGGRSVLVLQTPATGLESIRSDTCEFSCPS